MITQAEYRVRLTGLRIAEAPQFKTLEETLWQAMTAAGWAGDPSSYDPVERIHLVGVAGKFEDGSVPPGTEQVRIYTPGEPEKLFEATDRIRGVIRLERWHPQGLVLWAGGEIVWKSWR